jgi:hypothetical protein
LADEYQIQWEYTNGNTIDFKTDDLKITLTRPGLRLDTAIDGTILVTDPNNSKLIFNFTAVLSGNTMDTLHGVYTAAISYDGTYPRVQKIYWDGDSTETNIKTAMTKLEATDLGAGWWNVAVTLEEYG